MAAGYQNLDIRFLKGVGERRAELFAKLGADTVGALLRMYPRGYLDLRDCFEIAEAPLYEACAVKATVESKGNPYRISGGRVMTRVHAADETASLTLTYFNNRFAPSALKEGETYVFYGKLQGSLLQREMINPVLIKPE